MTETRTKKWTTLRMTQIAILIAIEVIVALTPIGMIKIPPISITTMHIPVIIAAILLGPTAGGIVGGVFGLCAVYLATTSGNVGDILFSPFASGNPAGSLIMCLVPRILLGIFTAYLFILFQKIVKKELVSIPIAAAIGAILHTLMVLGLMWLFFRAFPLIAVFTTAFSLNVIVETIIAVIITTAVSKPLLNIVRKRI